MKTIIKITSFLILFISTFPILGQNHYKCGNEHINLNTKVAQCTESSIDYNNQYKHKEFYIPNLANNTIKTLHINFNIWQRHDGSGNLINNAQTIARLKQIAIWINNKYQYVYPRYTPLPYTVQIINDSKIRIVLDSIYFYTDPTLDSSYYISNYGGHNILLDNYLKTNFPERTRALNIHLTKSYNLNYAGYSNFGSIESFYHSDPEMATHTDHDYWFSEHWAHEIGHSFDLWHTYDVYWSQNCNKNYPDFLWDLYDTTLSCPSLGCNVCILPASTTNNNLMGGGDNGHISALQMGIVHRSTIMENFYNIDYNVRDHITGYSINPYVITKNEIWDFSMKFYQNIIIKSGKVLTVKCEIQFVPEAKIIVEQGAKLIIDGGKLTNEKYYDVLWQGIEVWGTSNQPQNSVLSSSYQGIVELKNGAIIENAENAITLWHPGDWNSMGGIVYANNASFLNNRRSVEFMAYQNTTPNGNPIRNLSQFSNCTFKVDDNYRGGSSNPFSQHVTLWAVNGVFFTACNFLNEQSNKVYDSYNNKAIYSIDAGYTVTGSCSAALMYGQTCPDQYLTKSYFKGFNNAIYAMGASSQNVVKVDETVFEENVYGVQYNSLNNSWVNRSEFKIGNNTISCQDPNQSHIGISTISSTGFRIEENNLQTSSISVPNTIGVRINNSSVNISNANNQIYKNTFSNLNIGEQAEGINRDPNNAYNGLKILCNTFTNSNTNDIAVFPYNSSSDGICMYQGSSVPPLSAGNIFSGINCDYKNMAPWGILYHHTGGATIPNMCGNIGLSEIQVANTCPSNFNNAYDFPLSAVSKLQLSAEYTVNESAYINLLYNYNNLIDGGNKNWLLEKIEMSWPQDAWDLRAELLSHSPYLSEEILRETAMKGTLPQAMLLEICLANPDGTRNEEFLRFLGEKTPNPLPQYMLDLIYANRDVKTARTLLETNLSAVSSKMAYISGLLISDCMLDSIQLKAEARSWLLRRASLADYYSVAESYIENNDFTSANATADQISNIFELKEEQQAEFQNFRNYIEFRRSISESGRSIMQLEPSEIESLQQIANATTGRTSAMAQNILCFGYQLCVDYLPAEGDGNHLKFTKPEKTAKQILQSAYNKITVTPNPANVFVAFNYELPLLEDNAVIYITDAMGKTITQKSISSKKGQWVWDTRNINKGIYFYEIKSAAESFGNGKIVISK